MRVIEIPEPTRLADYESWPDLSLGVRLLRDEASRLVPLLDGRRVWMINSTASGGGVAEMMPRLISLLREVGVDTRWGVLESGEPGFFELTKRIHDLIHDSGKPELSASERELFVRINRENFDALRSFLLPGDLVVIHDPQPAPLAAMVRTELGNRVIWRCHIGLDRETERTRLVWEFLREFVSLADHAIFSVPDYIPRFLRGRSSIIHPAIDPLSPKNRYFSPRKLQGILCNSRLATEHAPVLHPPYRHPALRLAASGEWLPANEPEEIGLLFRPMVTQVSRWDRLKGFEPLLDALILLKQKAGRRGLSREHDRRLKIVRFILAGPNPGSVADDPGGKELLESLSRRWLELEPALQADIALLALPMASRSENAYMVNAIQRCSSIVVQNSIEEGFGLTVTEAMWKRVAVLGSRAAGIRQQIRDGVDGMLIGDPTNPAELADALDQLLVDPSRRGHLAGNAQRRVFDEFLIFSQVRSWLRTLVSVARANGLADRPRRPAG
ncbi:MAG TPA: glycosyltransferase [Thermoanaerobaculia bacterium]|nr:glycosyltransferase [Thermoanaerobaculia bacterium]